MKHFFFIIIITTLFGCQTSYIINQEGGLRPKDDNFFAYKRKPFLLSDTLLIDINSIYIRPILVDSKNLKSVENYYVYYRFFPTGQVLISPMLQNFPTISEINNVQWGTAGYYKFSRNKKIIKIEFLDLIYGGVRSLQKAKIVNGDLFIFTLNPRTFYGFVPYNSKTEKWSKVRIDGMTFPKIDW